MTTERELLEKMAEALRAKRIMESRGPIPKKLDEALGWRANDELAERVAVEALAAYDAYISHQPSDNAKVILNLRKRIHMLEKHNQWFERCESAWCNPSNDNDPAAGDVGLAWKPPAEARTLGADGHFEDCPCHCEDYVFCKLGPHKCDQCTCGNPREGKDL